MLQQPLKYKQLKKTINLPDQTQTHQLSKTMLHRTTWKFIKQKDNFERTYHSYIYDQSMDRINMDDHTEVL